MHDVIIIGAGSAGLQVAAAAERAGLRAGLVEQACLAGNFCDYPKGLQFRSWARDFEIEGFPFTTRLNSPARDELINYYQKVARRLTSVKFYLRHRASEVVGADNAFLVKARDLRKEAEAQIRCRKVVIATGCFNYPRLLQIAGEDLPHVRHYYSEPWVYEGARIVVVGGGDSAAEATVELAGVSDSITLIHRGKDFDRVNPVTQGSLKRLAESEQIKIHLQARVLEIKPGQVVVNLKTKGEQTIPADEVFLLTGYRPDDVLLQKSGVTIDLDGMVPVYFGETFESNISGIYLAGTLLGGTEAGTIGVESFGDQAEIIVREIQSKI